MKNVRAYCGTIALALLLCGAVTLDARAALLASWNFNDSNLTVDTGSGTLTHNFATGSSGLSFGSAGGSTINAVGATTAGNGLILNAGASNGANNGKFITFDINTTGFENLVFSYAAKSEKTGDAFTTHTLSYSLDGTNFISVPAASPSNTFGVTEAAFTTATFNFSAISGTDNNANAKFRITFSGATKRKDNYIDNVQFNATVLAIPATISLSSAVNDTIITGGSGTLGATVGNSAAGGANNLNYTLGASVFSGSASLGAVAPGSGSVAPGGSQANTVSASSTNVGSNTIRFTATDGAASNSPQTLDSTLTVLAHSDAAFDNATGEHLSALITNGGNDLTIDFGTVLLGASAGQLDSAFDLLAQIVAAGFTAGLELDSITPGGGNDAQIALLGAISFANNAAGAAEGYTVSLDTTGLGSFSATYTFGLSDQNLSGATAANSEVLTLTVLGTVIPEPAGLALLGLGTLLIVYRPRGA